MSTLLLVLATAGCSVAEPSVLEQCELDLALDTDSAMVGDTVTAVGRPITAEIDTAVRIDGLNAPLVDVDRPQPACEGCDACRVAAECEVCEQCSICAPLCEECIEVVAFEVPELDAGEYAVTVVNSYGVSPPMPLQIVPEADDRR